MLVHELMSRSVVTLHQGTTITAAARTLLAADITAAPVVDDPEPPHLVHDVMSHQVIAVAPGADDAEAAQLMLGNGLASLPVLDHGEIVGMVSVTDIPRSHTHADAEIAQVLPECFFEYGESHPLGVVDVAEGVVGVHVEPAHLRPGRPTTPHDTNSTPTLTPRNRT